MPLEEISGNIPRSRDPSLKDSRHESTTTLPAPPSAVQSMLKTTTELGDLGRFGTGTSGLPRSGSRIQSTRARSGSYDPSFASAMRHDRSPYQRSEHHHGPRPALSTSTLSTRYASRSNLSTHAPSQRPRRHRHRVPPPTSPHPSIYTHRSLVTLRSQQDVHSVRSTSPGGPMHRVRRPPHRIGSPAYTENRSLYGSQPSFFRAPSTGTVASSPAPSYRHGPYPRERNASYSSLNRSAMAHQAMRPGLLPSFAPPMRFGSPDLVNRLSTPARPEPSTSLVVIPQSPSGSTAPAYYDYTESFVEESCFSPDTLNEERCPPLTMDQTIWEGVPTTTSRDAQTPFGTREGSKFYPSELPTKHNRRPSEQSRRSAKSAEKHSWKKPGSRQGGRRPLFNSIPGRSSSIDATKGDKSDPEQTEKRQTQGEDSGAVESPSRDPRRTRTVMRRPGTSSPSTAFFASSSRSDRDLAQLAARVHSPTPTEASSLPRYQPRCEADRPEGTLPRQELLRRQEEPIATSTPEWQIPSFKFRPMSFMSESPADRKRPRTSEAASNRSSLPIHSPMPKRPTSSQSRKRFSKILDVDTLDQQMCERVLVKQPSCAREPSLKVVEEGHERTEDILAPNNSPIASLEEPSYNFVDDKATRISGVTSHDKSTVESLLDRHIECLGLQPDHQDYIHAPDSSETHDVLADKREYSTDTSNTIKLTDLLANVPVMERGRPVTSTSHQYPSLATLDKHALKPRRLFASVDARVPGTIEELSLPLASGLGHPGNRRPSYGWQTLPSTSILGKSLADLPTLTSGELADVDTSETRSKLKVKRRSLMSTSGSELSILSTLSSAGLDPSKSCGLHMRSKSEIIARQASHRRRRIRIRLKMKTRSQTTGDLTDHKLLGHTALNPFSSTDTNSDKRQASGSRSPVAGLAELSGDSVKPSYSNLGNRLSIPPPIPNRWSSIIAAMPLPGKKSPEIRRKQSVRSHRSQRSNTSITEPINSTRINKPMLRKDSVPQLGVPDLGPPLTSSELNLSIPYAEVPSTIRPTLRETKSFFSDNSSAQHQKGTLRQKLHLHSLRNVFPSSSLASVSPFRKSTGVALSHSCQMKGRPSEDRNIEQADPIVPMTDFAYRRRKVMEKFKDWWRRQCLQKVVSGRKARKGERVPPGAMRW